MRPSHKIVTDINEFEPTDGNWLGLDILLNELWDTGEQEKYTKELLRVFERFPDDDGGGVFWSIIHGLESFTSYERELVDSLRQQPSEMGLTMLRRIQNTRVTTIGGVEIKELIDEIRRSGQLTVILKEKIDKIVA